MKKAVVIIIALMLTAGLCACNVTVSTPEDTVESFFSALKAGDQEELILFTDNNDINTLLNNTLDEAVKEAMYNDLMANLEWEITSIETNEEQTAATVSVTVTNSDFSNVLKKYKKEATDYMMYNLYNEDVTKKVMKKKCEELFAQEIKNASESKDKPVSTDVKIELNKNDSYTWDMVMTKELSKAAIGGMKWPAQ